LIAAVQPQPMVAAVEATVRRAAERSQGLPGRFAHLLPARSAPPVAVRRGAGRHLIPRVAELSPVYGGEARADVPAPAVPANWPSPGALAILRRKAGVAGAQLPAGRHAPGIRHLREAIGGLARRSDWIDAADGTLLLAGV